jgi:cobalt transporter subunit CbtA
MKLFQRLIWAALAVALLVGSLQTLVQHAWAVPIILKAETFEDQKISPPEPAHEHAAPSLAAHAHDRAQPATEAWAPQDGAERSFWTWVANVLHGFGMALLALVVLSLWEWRRPAGTPRWAMALGVAAAGFLSLHLWPSLGLHAEIPGMDAARLGSRQGWWLLAVGGAVAACGALAFGRSTWRWVVAAAGLAVPFVVGAPHITSDPLAGFGPDAQQVLRELGEQFVWVTHGIAVSFWLSLGAASAWVFTHWVRGALPIAEPLAWHDTLSSSEGLKP